MYVRSHTRAGERLHVVALWACSQVCRATFVFAAGAVAEPCLHMHICLRIVEVLLFWLPAMWHYSLASQPFWASSQSEATPAEVLAVVRLSVVTMGWASDEEDSEASTPTQHRGGLRALAKIRARAQSAASSMPPPAGSAAPSLGAASHRRLHDASAAEETPPAKRARRGAAPSAASPAVGAAPTSSSGSSAGEPCAVEGGALCTSCLRAYRVDCSWQTATQDFQ